MPITTKTRTHALTGREIVSLMRRNRVTIAELSRRLDIPQTIIRRRRINGVAAPAAFDWRQAIEGEWNADLDHDFKMWRGGQE